MSSSSLATLKMISPNSNNPRNHVIDTITIHHTACCVSAKRIGEIFQPVARQASCNYGIGNDGQIVLVVDEANRSWCSSSRVNDNRAITIEVSNDEKGCKDGTWTVSAAAMKSLIKLVADICKRNNIKKLVWSNDKATRLAHKNGANMTLHKDLAATGCPGPYLESKMPYIATEVNKLLNPEPKTLYRVQIGAFTNKAYAEAYKQKAIKAGFTDSFIVAVKKA